MACPIKDSCSFFNNQIRMMDERKETLKSRFCLSTHSQCARFNVYQYFKSSQKVPADLYPDNYELASDLVQRDKKHGEHKF